MPSPVPVDRRWLASFRRRLRTWYARNARKLPWRTSRDPYAVWVSEIMLQQTQVATVKLYFERFLAAFPTIEALAQADEHDVLRLWEGLGYYRRARQMHEAAGILVRDHGGRFPRDAETVRRLPGVGRYTAGAILSIAFDAREPILEANTTRLFSRLLALRGEKKGTGTVCAKPGSDRRLVAGRCGKLYLSASSSAQLLWAMAEAVLPRKDTGAFNQALMELGGKVCLPKRPRCDGCPVAPLCRALAEGIQSSIPPAKPKRAIQPRHEAALIVRRGRHVLVWRCPEGGRWAGLWDFPRFPVDAARSEPIASQLGDQLRQQTGVVVEAGRHLATLKHSVTRFRITLDCFEARWLSGPNAAGRSRELRWLRPAELADYALSTTGRKLAELALRRA